MQSKEQLIEKMALNKSQRPVLSRDRSWTISECMMGIRSIRGTDNYVSLEISNYEWGNRDYELLIKEINKWTPCYIIEGSEIKRNTANKYITFPIGEHHNGAPVFMFIQVLRSRLRNSTALIDYAATYIKKGYSFWEAVVIGCLHHMKSTSNNYPWSLGVCIPMPIGIEEFKKRASTFTTNKGRAYVYSPMTPPTMGEFNRYNSLKSVIKKKLTFTGSPRTFDGKDTTELNLFTCKDAEKLFLFLKWVAEKKRKRTLKHFYSQPSHKGLLDDFPWTNYRFVTVRTGVKKKEVELKKNLVLSNLRHPGEYVINNKECLDGISDKQQMKEDFSRLFKDFTPDYRLLYDKSSQSMGGFTDVDDVYQFILDTGWTRVYAKRRFRSKGVGMHMFKIKTEKGREELREFLQKYCKSSNIINGRFNPYIIEEGHNTAAEYRVHVSRKGIFFALRKLRKSDTPKEERWYFNSKNSIFQLEFDKPKKWATLSSKLQRYAMIKNLVTASFDVRFYSDDGKHQGKFMIIEANSEPSMGDTTKQHFKEQYFPYIEDILFNPL